jgi:acyl-CoA synthetase (NDP forming)
MMTANYFLTANLLNLKYTGTIYPVNPNTTEIMGLEAYSNLQSIEDEVDSATVSVPVLKTLDVVRDCIAKGVKGIVIIAGGFSETGNDGKGLQEGVKGLLEENSIRVIGPNSLSPLNSVVNFIIAFGFVEKLRKLEPLFNFKMIHYQPHRLSSLLVDTFISVQYTTYK